MHLLQRILFPQSLETAGLYFLSDAPLFLMAGPAPSLKLERGQSLSCNTFYNSHYRQYFAAYTNAADVAWRLRLVGEAKVSLYGESLGQAPALLVEHLVRGETPDAPVCLDVPPTTCGRVYLRFEALSDVVVLHGGELVTTASPRPVRLAVVITAYKRDAYVHATVRALLDDAELTGVSEILLVDHGGTLSGYEDEPRVRIVPNVNTGGAGGFSRGMMEVLESGRATHILIMDDDIVLHAEVVLRTIAFFAHASRDVAVSGAMLDSEKTHLLHEAGARWTWGIDVSRPSPLKLLPLKQGVYLQSSLGLNALLHDERPDYGAFWFFAFSVDIPRRHGLCLPFFVVGDDIDFGLKVTRQAGTRIVPLPSVAVRHVPFYFKLDSLAPYFFYRNLLVVSAVHDRFRPITVAARVLLELFKALCTYDYPRAFKIVRGVEDFLEGPGKLSDCSLEAIAEECQRVVGASDTRELATPAEDAPPFGLDPGGGCLRDLVRWLLVGGHLVPSALLSSRPGRYCTGRPLQWKSCFGHREVLIHHTELHVTWLRRIRQLVGLRLFVRGLRCAMRLLVGWKRMSATWRAEARRMSGVASWKRRLGMEHDLQN